MAINDWQTQEQADQTLSKAANWTPPDAREQ